MADPRLSVIVLNYNNHQDTNDCLHALHNVEYRDLEVLVVDNGSDTDPESELVSYDEVRYFRREKNIGFGPGCNYAARQARGDYLFFLNNDALIEDGTLPMLLSVIERDEETAAVVPRVFFEHDRTLIDKGVGLFDNLGFGWHPHHLASEGDADVPTDVRETAWGSGCALLVDKAIFEELDGFDDDFFLYTDDLDLSIRLRKAGYRIQLVPDATVYHKYSRGVKDELDLDRTPFQSFHEQRNRAKFLTKHYPPGILLRYLPHILLSFLFWDAVIAYNGRVSLGAKALANQCYYAGLGVQDRQAGQEDWTEWMVVHTLKDYLEIGLNRKKYYEGEYSLPERIDWDETSK